MGGKKFSLSSQLLSQTDQDKRLVILKAFKEHIENYTAIDVNSGCWIPMKDKFETGSGLCISTDASRCMMYVNAFLLKYNVKLPGKCTTQVARFYLELYAPGLLEAAAKDKKVYRYNASHLCNNPACVNPGHVVGEEEELNKSRNYCRGGRRCKHYPQCLRPGCKSTVNPVKNQTIEMNF